MTAAVAQTRAARPAGRTIASGIVAVIGCGLLAARPALVELSPGSALAPTLVLTALFVAVLVLGARLPLPYAPQQRLWSTGPAVLVGVTAFALGRVLVGGHPLAPATALFIAANTLAAVAEEAWFRRLCFGLLAPAGTGIAIAGSTLLFAAVHVSIYGLWVLPLDVAAGLVLGWQRSTTGSWAAPAITHVIANLLMAL